MNSRRFTLAQARGLGAAGTGTDVWFTQRLTWLFSLVLSALVLILVLSHLGKPYAEFRAVFAGFYPTVLLLLFVAVTSFHYVLELQEVIEDYVHNRVVELSLLIGVRLVFSIFALGAILMIFRNFLEF